jgi:hypothetical protein
LSHATIEELSPPSFAKIALLCGGGGFGISSNVTDVFLVMHPKDISKYGNERLHENPSDRDESYGFEKQRGPAIHNCTNMPPPKPPPPHSKAILAKDGGLSSSMVA